MVGGVRDGEEAAVVEAVGEEVVEHAAVGLAEDAVLGAALGDLGHVVGEDPLEELLRLRAARLDLAHVRDVEQPGLGAHVHVLLADALVLHRHLPAGERHDARPGGLVAVVERSSAERLGGGAQEESEAIGIVGIDLARPEPCTSGLFGHPPAAGLFPPRPGSVPSLPGSPAPRTSQSGGGNVDVVVGDLQRGALRR